MQKTCIIIPCYNESVRINLAEFQHLIEIRKDIDFCFVNDGSKDDTLSLLEEFKQKNITRIDVLNLLVNVGKAEAVRQGFKFCLKQSDRYHYYGFMDADLATPTSQLIILIDYGINNNKLFLFGSRVKRLGVDIDRKPLRHYLGRLFATTAYHIIKLPIYDTQCGLKIMTYNLANIAFESKFISKWIFDIEIFLRLKNQTCSINIDFIEIPLNEWHERSGSKLTFIELLRVPKDLYKIWRKY